MIFVTVGTSYSFDPLVKEIDKIAPFLKEKVIVQIGKGKYKPKNCIYFDYKKDLTPYYKKASIVISHGGAGTCFTVLGLGKKLIAVANPKVNDDHQPDLLTKLSEDGYIVWCKDLSKLKDSIESINKKKLAKYKAPKCTIAKKIIEWLK